MGKELYEFGPFRVDPEKQTLLRGDELIALNPKTFQLLLVLVRRGNQIVTKDELMKEVWPDTFVEEANVTQHVSVLRKTLSDAAGDGRQWIETFPKRGYRFVGVVDVGADGMGAGVAGPAVAPPRASVRDRFSRNAVIAAVAVSAVLLAIGLAYVVGGMRQSGNFAELAVLPFRVLAPTGAQPSHLGVGIADAIVTRLANVESIRVRPTSAMGCPSRRPRRS